MKTRYHILLFALKRLIVLFGAVTLLILIQVSVIVAADSARQIRPSSTQLADTSVTVELQKHLLTVTNKLAYPESVTRFYQNRKYTFAWIKPKTEAAQTWEAMLLLDCVLQFGLSHADYHAKELSYLALHEILENPENVGNSEKADFDIMLTDALVTFINHLHYGKLNPEYPAGIIDDLNKANFRAEKALSAAQHSKDFFSTIGDVQPKAEAYKLLQDQMRLIAGQYAGDCYETPDAQVQKIAVNLERLRWMNNDDSVYLHVNIPSFQMIFHQPDTIYTFKVIVGKPDHPTPTLKSRVRYFTTAPEWNVPARIFAKELLPKAMRDTAYLYNNQFTIYNKKGEYIVPTISNLNKIRANAAYYYARQSAGCDNALGSIVFRFPNLYSVYLHDTLDKALFKSKERALSHGCIRVEHPDHLASLLLKYDHAVTQVPALRSALATYKTQSFTLKRAVPIYITYITCEVDNSGLLINYKDIYNLDEQLKKALYNIYEPLAKQK